MTFPRPGRYRIDPEHSSVTPALEITNLRKRYGKKTAVDDLSLCVSEGEIFGILGPNGAGKPNIGIRHFLVQVSCSSCQR